LRYELLTLDAALTRMFPLTSGHKTAGRLDYATAAGMLYYENQLLIADRVNILLSANVNPPVGDRRRRVNRFANRIRADDLVLRTGFHDERVAVFTSQQDLAVKRDRRRGEGRGDRNAAAFVLDLAGLRVDARQNAAVGRQVKIVTVKNRRRHVSGAFCVLPRHVRSAGQVATAAES